MTPARALLGIATALLALGGAWWLLGDVEREGGRADEEPASAPEHDEGDLAGSSPVGSRAESLVDPGAQSVGTTSDAEPVEPADEVLWRGRVDGRVVDEGGRPIAGAVVRVLGQEGQTAVSDAAGTFEGPLVLVGGDDSYRAVSGRATRLVVEASGYAWSERFVSLTVEGDVHLGTIRLRPGGEARGRVLGPDGAPVSGALVGWRLASRSGQAGQLARYGLQRVTNLEPPDVSTDGEGSFVLRGVPVGEGFLVAGAPGLDHARTEVVTVAPGAVVERELILPAESGRRVTLSGHVVGQDRAPLDGVEVFVWGSGPSSFHGAIVSGRVEARTLTTDADGRFALTFPCYESTVQLGLRVTDPRERGRGTTLADVDPDAGPLEIVLEAPRFVAVRQVDARGEPVRRGHVLVQGGRAWVALGDSGSARVMLPEQPFTLESVAPGYVRGTVGPFDPAGLPEALVLTMLPGQFAGGRVLDGDGPVAGARVGLVDALDPGDPRSSTTLAVPERPFASLVARLDAADDWITEEDGRFVVSLQRAGWYGLVVEAEGRPRTVFGPWKWDLGGVDGLELRLEPAGAIAGRMLVPAGRSPEGRLVGASSGWGFAHTAVVASDGSFRIEGLAPGSYQVRPCEPPAATVQTYASSPGRGSALAALGYASSESEEPRPARPIAWDCTVLPGRDTPFVLDARDEEAFVLRGRLPLPAASASWQVVLSSEEAVRRTELSSEGELELATSRGGPWGLLVHSELGEFQQPLELEPGVNEWAPEIEWGFIEIVGHAGGSAHNAGVRVDLGARLGFELVTTLPADGGARRLEVPAGPGRLHLAEKPRSAPWSGAPRTVEVLPGETVLVDLAEEPR